MPLDPEVQAAIDNVGRELREELRTARSPRDRDDARGDAVADLDDVLRANGYRLTRRELDALVAAQEEERITAAVERALAARDAAAGDEDEDEDDDDDDGGEDGDKPKPKAKPKAKTADGDDDEAEWK